MEQNRKHETYLAKARQADEMAEKAKIPEIRATWNKIAENYRDLASYARKRLTPPAHPPKDPGQSGLTGAVPSTAEGQRSSTKITSPETPSPDRR